MRLLRDRIAAIMKKYPSGYKVDWQAERDCYFLINDLYHDICDLASDESDQDLCDYMRIAERCSRAFQQGMLSKRQEKKILKNANV